MGAGIAEQLPPIPMSPLLGQTLARAAEYAQEQSHAEVAIDHLLLALTEDDAARQVMGSSGVDIPALQTDVSQQIGRIEDRLPPGQPPTANISEELRRILNAAAIAARAGRRNSIDGAIVLAAIIGDAKTSAAGLLRAHGLTFEVAIDAIRQVARAAPQEPSPNPPGNAAQPSSPPINDALANARARVASRKAAGYSDQLAQQRQDDVQPSEGLDSFDSEFEEADVDAQEPEPQPDTGVTSAEPAPTQPQSDADTLSADLNALIVAASNKSPDDRTVAQTSIVPVSEENPLRPPAPPPPAVATPKPSPQPAPLPQPPPQTKKQEAPVEARQEPAAPNAGPPPAPPPTPPNPSTAGPPPAEKPATANPLPPPPPPGAARPQQQPAWTPPAGENQNTPPQQPRGAPPPVPANAPMRPPPPAPGNPAAGVVAAARAPDQAPPPVDQPRRDASWTPPPGHQPIPPVGPPRVQPRGSAPGAPPPPSGATQGLPTPDDVFNQPAQNPHNVEPLTKGPNRAPQTPPPSPTLTGGIAPGAGSAPSPQETPTVLPGQLVENVPRKMRVGISSPVEVRIAKAEVKAISEGLDMGVTAFRHEVQVTKAMSVRLRAPEGGFFIETASPETQWIENALGLMADDYARWRWNVTPKLRGKRRLQLIVSARTVGPDGLAAETALPDQIIEIRVATNYARLFKSVAGWAVAGMLGGVLAKFGSQIWTAVDPLIKSLMQ
ncbi:MAG: Clp protease N-terminal domain-containing protein [Filomicrobium sp.]